MVGHLLLYSLCILYTRNCCQEMFGVIGVFTRIDFRFKCAVYESCKFINSNARRFMQWLM